MANEHPKVVVGTSGYSFTDWVGTFYPPGTRQKDMFDLYARHFGAVELNFTFYNDKPGPALVRMADKAPDGFAFWVKAHRELTHKGNLAIAEQFLDHVQAMQPSGKLAGLLLQFPQSFHRTAEAQRYLNSLVDALDRVGLAAEFRHHSWDHPSTLAHLAKRNVTLVIPDVPAIQGLYRPTPAATTPTAYLRLHSRNAEGWYAGMGERYDYSYSDQELKELVKDWSAVENKAQCLYAFFNNCYHAQAAKNAEAFRRILGQII